MYQVHGRVKRQLNKLEDGPRGPGAVRGSPSTRPLPYLLACAGTNTRVHSSHETERTLLRRQA